MTYQEGQTIWKRRGIRVLVAIIIAFVCLIIGLIVAIAGFKDYKIVDSAEPPTKDSVVDIKDPFLGISKYRVPLTADEQREQLKFSLSIILGGAALTGLALANAFRKDKFIYQNGKLIIDPEFYLRSTARDASLFFFGIGTIALVLRLSGHPEYTYGGIVGLYMGSVIYFVAYKLPIQMLTKFFVGALVLSLITTIVEGIIINKSVPWLSILLTLAFYGFIFRKVKSISKTPSSPAVSS